MNETSNPNPGSGDQANQSSHSSSGRGPFDSLRDALNEGAQQAKAAAEKAVPKIKAAVSDATYWAGYGVSFAAVFSYTVATELAPDVLKAGGRDGAAAGKKAAEDFATRCKAQGTRTGEPSAPGSDSVAQPGPA
jgi:hypothetical protein